MAQWKKLFQSCCSNGCENFTLIVCEKHLNAYNVGQSVKLLVIRGTPTTNGKMAVEAQRSRSQSSSDRQWVVTDDHQL